MEEGLWSDAAFPSLSAQTAPQRAHYGDLIPVQVGAVLQPPHLNVPARVWTSSEAAALKLISAGVWNKAPAADYSQKGASWFAERTRGKMLESSGEIMGNYF